MFLTSVISFSASNIINCASYFLGLLSLHGDCLTCELLFTQALRGLTFRLSCCVAQRTYDVFQSNLCPCKTEKWLSSSAPPNAPLTEETITHSTHLTRRSSSETACSALLPLSDYLEPQLYVNSADLCFLPRISELQFLSLTFLNGKVCYATVLNPPNKCG